MNSTVQRDLFLAGLASIVPVPFLDAWLARKALRRALAADAESVGAPLDAGALDLLVEDRSSLVLGCLATVVIWPIRKLFRTVFWFLTLKDVVDGWAWASETVAMVRIARRNGWLPAHTGPVRDAIEEAFERHRWSPVTRWLLRYERPALDEEDAAGTLGKLLQGLRRQAGAAPMEAMFRHRVREQLGSAPASTPDLPASG